MSYLLKNGQTTEDKRLDRVYELDWKSLDYPVTALLPSDILRYPRSYTHRLKLWLDQGEEGACVGFGYAHDLACTPAPVLGITDQYARERLYWEIQRRDPWEGGAYPDADPVYEGTSVLTGAKWLTELGYYESYYWGLTTQDVVIGIGYGGGPCILGLNWYSGMYDTGANGFISATGSLEGGHCILAVGVKVVWKSWINRFVSRTWENVDLDRSYLILHNSWGPSWGENGRCKLSLKDFERLLAEEGDVCFPRRRRNVLLVP